MRGICFVRPIETAETMPGGQILLPDSYRERLTAQQAEIVAVGPPGLCGEVEDCERSHTPSGHHVVDPRLVPGAWVLCAKWSYVGVREKLFAVRHEDVIGIFVEDHEPPKKAKRSVSLGKAVSGIPSARNV